MSEPNPMFIDRGYFETARVSPCCSRIHIVEPIVRDLLERSREAHALHAGRRCRLPDHPAHHTMNEQACARTLDQSHRLFEP